MTRNTESDAARSPLEIKTSGIGEQRLGAKEEGPREYVRPTILSHSGEEILEDLGPAQACYPYSPLD